MSVRALTASDVDTFLDLIDALADYERLARPDTDARQRLAHDALALVADAPGSE